MCFVLNTFLNHRKGLGFIYSSDLHIFKGRQRNRVCYDLFSRGFLFAFYKPFCFGKYVLLPRSSEKTSRTWQDSDKEGQLSPTVFFTLLAKKKGGWVGLVLIFLIFPLSSISHTPIYKHTLICTHKQFKCAKAEVKYDF